MIDPKIQKLRGRITEIKAELARLQADDTPITQTAALARVDQIVAGLQAAGDATLDALAGRLVYRDPGLVRLVDVDNGRNPDAAAQLLAALDPQKLREALRAKVRSEYQTIGEVATPAEIKQRVGKLTIELDKTEREDFTLSDELGVPQRADINPMILLGG